MTKVVKVLQEQVIAGRVRRVGEICNAPDGHTYHVETVVMREELERRANAQAAERARLEFKKKVDENPPIAVIIAPATATVREPVTFDGRQSTAGPLEIVQWNWEPDVDGVVELHGAVVEYEYTRADTYTLALNVIDEYGRKGHAEAQIVVSR